jgi:hypothetical protein
MATMTLRVARIQGGYNGTVQSERKEIWAVTVASNHIDGASKYCSAYNIVFSYSSQDFSI